MSIAKLEVAAISSSGCQATEKGRSQVEKTPGALIVEGMVLGDVTLMLKQVACDCIDGAEPAGAIGSENPGIRGAAHAGFLVGVR